MNKSFNKHGSWFLNNDRSKTINGELRYNCDSSNIELHLEGNFDTPLETENKESKLIHGISQTGELITLIYCIRTRSNNFFNEYAIHSESIYVANYMCIGFHYTSIDQISFKTAKVHISFLEQWVDYWVAQVSIDLQTKITSIICDLPSDINFNINDDKSGSFGFSYIPLDEHSPHVSIIQETYLKLYSRQPLEFKTFLDFINNFNQFISLGVHKSMTFIEKITFFDVMDESICVDFYYSSINKQVIDDNKLSKFDFLYTYRDIEEKFEPVINKWFSFIDKNKPVVTLFFYHFSQNHLFTINKLINITQALETFHRRNFTNESDSEFDTILGNILSKLDNDEKTWIQEKLQHKNEPNLRKRLKELIKAYPHPTIDKLFTNTTSKSFINEVVNSRNYYTHYSEQSESSSLSGYKLYMCVEKLFILLLVIFLCEIEIDEALINRISDQKRYNLLF